MLSKNLSIIEGMDKPNHLVKTIDHIKAEDLELLFDDKLLALRFPRFFSPESGRKASQWLLQNYKSNSWYLGKLNEILTDMNYLLGVPREVAKKSLPGINSYLESSSHFMQELIKAFDSETTPLHQFIQELEESYGHALPVEDFQGKPGLPAIVRHMAPETSIGDDVFEEGVCHIDSVPEEKILSVNMYLNVPSEGGELKIWDLSLKERNLQNSLYRLMMNHAFDAGYRDKIQPFLANPAIIKMDPGDLIIFDTSRPHAVRGFKSGPRVSLQTFLRKIDNAIYLFS